MLQKRVQMQKNNMVKTGVFVLKCSTMMVFVTVAVLLELGQRQIVRSRAVTHQFKSFDLVMSVRCPTST
jgi:hypothetical protein